MSFIDTLTMFGTAIVVAPIALLGVEFVAGGRLFVGVGFLAVAAALVVAEHYIGVPGLDSALEGVLGVVAPEPESDEPTADTDEAEA
ncbi:MAG: hypothetical protein ACI8UR_001501 [Natronomonas sp.]|jgi:hypothetical protein|uniref:DUF7533 family protein n=1 Tax=Natronomonas sp. TaxID=2184060 RepID=UPI0039897837